MNEPIRKKHHFNEKSRVAIFRYIAISSFEYIAFIFNLCRKGSVIVHFTITFRELDSDELLIFTDTADKDGRIADLKVTSVSLLVAGGESFPMVLIELVLFAPEHSYQYNSSPK